MQDLDYTPLQRELTNQDLKQYRQQLTNQYDKLRHQQLPTSKVNPPKILVYFHIILGAGVGALLVLMGLVLALFSGGFTRQVWGLFTVALILAPCISWLSYHSSKKAQKRSAKIDMFAQQNNLQYIPLAFATEFPGRIFGEGMSGLMEVRDMLMFQDGSAVGNYRLLVTLGNARGRARNRRYNPRWGCIQIKLQKTLPHMVLDSKINNELQGYTRISEMFGQDDQVKLEGNFNDYFTLYVKDNHKLDALYVFTPDVMAALIDYGSVYDVEIVDDTLIFYTGEEINLSSADDIQSVLSAIDKVGSQILHQVNRYRADDAPRPAPAQKPVPSIVKT